jgi:hypothetical protein
MVMVMAKVAESARVDIDPERAVQVQAQTNSRSK